MLRQYFPEGTDLSRWSADDLEAVAFELNNRPRKILGWQTPAEVFDQQIGQRQKAGTTVVEMSMAVAVYIENFYNTRRRHSSLAMLARTEHETTNHNQLQLS